ncbi:MAG: AmmeMemoRadiSam system protein B [Acidobacteriia bacterium]|nr:AmmeMemoRadiSam system protein B [Terriglobia bacterium]
MSTLVRQPAVAGRFYPNNPDKLLNEIRLYTASAGEKLRAIGCVAPHAGYMYSGHVAGAVYARLELPRKFIILCPNHTGIGQPLAIMSAGWWVTPLGNVEVDRALADALKQTFSQLSEDAVAHRAEHALEVQLPFLQALVGEFSFVPIAVGVGQLDVLQELGEAMARVIAVETQKPLIIASSDMNHYESDEITRVKDHKAIDRILELDARGLYDVVKREDISMCGYGPTVAMLTAAKRLGAHQAQVIKYGTSGDVSGDRDLVVGYAGIAVCA